MRTLIPIPKAKHRNIQCAILTRASTMDNRPKRERTRNAKIRKALREYE